MAKKSGRGSRERRKLRKREQRRQAKAMRYAASMRREGAVVEDSKNPDKKRRVNHRRGDPRTEIRRANAEARQAIRDGLSPGQQLDRLDIRLGRNVGAVKERARLAGG